MKRKNIKKRLAALRSGLMLSLCVISPFSVFKAANFNVIVTNEYGSFTRGNWSASILNTTYSTSAVIGELNGVYNGRVTINYSTDPTTTDLLFIPINCSMESSSGNSITIIFKNVSSFMVLIDGSGADSLQVNSMTGWNMTKISDGTNTQLNSVLSYIDNLETLITTNNTTLGLIYNYIQTLDTSNTDISIDVGDIQVDVNDIEVGIGDLLSAITSMITDGIDTITLGDILDELEQANSYLSNVNSKLQLIQGSLQSAVTHLSNLNNYTSQINTNVSDIELLVGYINTNILAAKNDIADIKTYINTIVTTLNNISTTLNNIDNTIDTITWVNSSRTVNISPVNSANWENITNNTAAITFSGSLNYSSIGSDRQVMYKLTVPLSITNLNSNIIVTMFNGNKDVSNNVLYVDYNSYQTVIYFGSNFDGSANNLTINVQSSDNYLRYTRPDLVPSTIQFITENDIEYWELYSSFIQFKKFDALLNAINSLDLSVTIDQTIEQEMNEYNTTLNNIDVVIDANLNPLRNNSTGILNSISNFPTLLLTPADNFFGFMKTHMFVNGRFKTFFTTYLLFLLFAILVGVMLG